jgi:hypothetical protein
VSDRLPKIGEILDFERVSRVIGKAAVQIEVEPLDLEVEPIEQRREPHRCHAVPAIDGDAERGTTVAHGQGVIDVLRHHVHLANPSLRRRNIAVRRRLARSRFEPCVVMLDLLESAGLADGDRVRPTDLEAVVFGGVVGRGQHDSPTRPEPIDGEVQHRGRHQPDVCHIGALPGHAAHQGLGQRGRARARIATDHQLGDRQETSSGAPDPVGILSAELIRNHSPDVIGLEDGHGRIVTTLRAWNQAPG